jgi:hypothetical protein
MAHLHRLAAGLCMLAMAAGGSAQPDTGHVFQHYDRARVPDGDSSGLEAQRILYNYGACLAKARRKQVEMFLATSPFTAKSDRTARKIASDECLMEGELSFPSETLRGPLYQELYRMDFGGNVPANVASAPALDYASSHGEVAAADPIHANLRTFADCAVRRDPAAARDFILSNVGSAGESAALQRMMAPMSSCIVQGDTVKMTRPLIRGAVAEVLYRLTAAATGRPAPADRS